MSGCTFIYSPLYYCDIGPHVFPMAKYALVRDALRADGDIPDSAFREPEPADEPSLARVHTPAYLKALLGAVETPQTLQSEMPISSEIVRAFRYAAGGTILACREALGGGLSLNIGGGFHHAFPDHAEGFCYLNDLAIAVRQLVHEGAVRRVMVIDLDVHQGNGTAFIFHDDPRVFTFSMHQESNYPPKQVGSLDIGLADGLGDKEFLALLRHHLPLALDEFKPNLALYQAGADVFGQDQLGGLSLTTQGIRNRDDYVIVECRRRGVPVAATLGGGYARNLSDTVLIHHGTCRAMWEARQADF